MSLVLLSTGRGIAMENQKSSYTVADGEITFRRLQPTDNFRQVARLIYDTDTYIYGFLCKHQPRRAEWLFETALNWPGFIFYHENIYIAYHNTAQRIVGVLMALDQSSNLEYDYQQFANISSEAAVVNALYFQPNLDYVRTLDPDHMLIMDLCVAADYRKRHIGTRLLGYFMAQMHTQGFNHFELDCLSDNGAALQLYHRLGYHCFDTKPGFNVENDTPITALGLYCTISDGDFPLQRFSPSK